MCVCMYVSVSLNAAVLGIQEEVVKWASTPKKKIHRSSFYLRTDVAAEKNKGSKGFHVLFFSLYLSLVLVQLVTRPPTHV